VHDPPQRGLERAAHGVERHQSPASLIRIFLI
jgi:hypothetical protein